MIECTDIEPIEECMEIEPIRSNISNVNAMHLQLRLLLLKCRLY